jgi:hypothetical protein
MTFLTVAERKRRSAERLAAAADAVIRELADYARKTGGPGRFIVFGSAASGEMRYDSDFDVIVDFPAAEEAAASVGVEIVAGEASCLIKLHGSGENALPPGGRLRRHPSSARRSRQNPHGCFHHPLDEAAVEHRGRQHIRFDAMAAARLFDGVVADETRRFRNLATRSYGTFDPAKAGSTVIAAKALSTGLLPTLLSFQDAADPPP